VSRGKRTAWGHKSWGLNTTARTPWALLPHRTLQKPPTQSHPQNRRNKKSFKKSLFLQAKDHQKDPTMAEIHLGSNYPAWSKLQQKAMILQQKNRASFLPSCKEKEVCRWVRSAESTGKLSSPNTETRLGVVSGPLCGGEPPPGINQSEQAGSRQS
jgi:hypothetical protein